MIAKKKDFHSEIDFILRVAGEGGEGVISCGELFARAAARTEYHVFTFLTYPAEMRGGFAMVQIRVRDWTIYSLGSRLDCLVAFNQPALERTIRDLKPSGTLIYDPGTVQLPDGLETSVLSLPLTDLSKQATGSALGKNIVALGALGYLVEMDQGILAELVRDRFAAKGAEVVKRNLAALSCGYDYAAGQGWPRILLMADLKPKGPQYMMLSGNEAIALGALVAGCRFAASYPITPATPIFETLTRLFPLVDGRAVQMEDEIAAVSAAIGASFAGQKALTSTSGPGLQLMTEQLNLASMIEVPLVVVDVQRGGPSTGLPTKTEQSDLNLAVYGVSGESPRIVLAPTSVEDSFYQTIRAFNLAERYQLPVIMLTDQSIGLRKATVQMPDLSQIIRLDSHVARTKVKIPRPEFINLIDRAEPKAKDLEDYRRFRITADGVSPIARPGTPDGQYLATGLEHTERGYPDYSPENHLQMSRKRFRKMEVIARSFDTNPIEIWGRSDAKIGIMGWGSTAGAIREARCLAEERGIYVRHMHPHTLSPMPHRQISNFLVRLEHLIIVEENYTGQFAHHIKAHFGVKAIELHKCEGIPITPEEILRGIEKVAGIIDEYSIAKL
ncbi:MAG: 2-oxoacid:acceptor oxidoreductase subunit alpha [Spirochaetales bacterium]|nr:2-oxoacid:acceptor oxidoreductase subunit alpha [Spirochaetales bacterium]